MGDIQPLQYNPMQTGLQAMQMLQMQQHLGLAASSQAMQQQNMAVDNARQAYQTANPMESYPAYANYAKLSGLPVPDVNSYYANPAMYDNLLNAEPGSPEHTDAMTTWLKTNPGSRAVVEKEVDKLRGFRGAKALGIASGLPQEEGVSSLIQQSPALQTQVGNALAQSPLQKAQAVALEQKQQEHNDLAANVNTQIGALLPISMQAKMGLDRSAPLVGQLSAIQQSYDKDAKNLGITAASKMRQDRIALNPELAQFVQRSQQAVDGLTQQVKQIEDGQTQLQTQAELAARGVQALPDGQSLHTMAGRIDASFQHLALARAQLALAKSPTQANYDAVKAASNAIETHIEQLTKTKASSQDALDIRRDAQVETARKNKAAEQLDARTAKGGALLLDAVNAGEKTDVAAARIAKQLNVNPADIKKALVDPNKPLTQIDIDQEKQESKTVGTGLGEQYLDTQKAGRAAMGTLNRLDRMDQLLTGMTTGKLTPAITDIQALGEAFGVKVDSTLPAKQAFTALANEMALQLRNPSGGAGMPGSLSDKDLAFLKSMTPSLSQTPEGNRLIIDSARQVAKRDQQVAKMARDYRKQNGSLDEGFYETVQNYADKNPLFAGKSVPGANVGPAQGGMPTIGQMDGGYIYKGGDPSKQESWEKAR